MEKTNWIEKIKEAIRVAMNKGLLLSGYEDKCQELFQFYIEENNSEKIIILCYKKGINISTKKGNIYIEYTLSDRDKLELQALILSVKEYREDMAISEFNNFFKEEETKTPDIDDLNDDDD